MTEGIQTREGLYGFEFRDLDQRRKDPGERKTYNIKAMWQRSHEIVNLAVKGYKQVDIADILGIDPQTVSNTLNSDLGKAKLAELRGAKDEEAKKTQEKIRVLTDKALQVYHDSFDDDSGELGLKDKAEIAKHFLNEMSGLRAPTRIHATSVSTTLTPEQIARFKERALAAAKESGMVIDVTPDETE